MNSRSLGNNLAFVNAEDNLEMDDERRVDYHVGSYAEAANSEALFLNFDFERFQSICFAGNVASWVEVSVVTLQTAKIHARWTSLILGIQA